MACENCGMCQEQWSNGIKWGPASPVVMVCNVAGVTDINEVEFITECYQEVDDCTRQWTRVTIVQFIAGEQQDPSPYPNTWVDPDGNVTLTAPGVALEKCTNCKGLTAYPVCYLIDTEITINTVDWEILTPSLVRSIVPVGNDSITFEVTRVSGPQIALDDSVPCVPDTPITSVNWHGTAVNSIQRFSWDREIVGPFTISIWDVDPTELVTVVSGVPADSIVNVPGAASGQWSTFTWNNAEDLGGSVELEFTEGCYSFGIQGTFTIKECRKAWAFFNCDKSVSYTDMLTGNDVIDPELLDCNDSPCVNTSTYVTEIGCYYSPTADLPSPPNAPPPNFFNDFPIDGTGLWEYSNNSGATWTSPAPTDVYHNPPGIAAGVNRWRTTFTIPADSYQGTWDIITSGDMYDTGEPFEGELWLNGVLINTTDHAAGSTTTIPIAPGTYTLEWREAQSTIEGNTTPNIVADYTNVTILPTAAVGGITVEAVKEISREGEILSVTLYSANGELVERVDGDSYLPGPCAAGSVIECPKIIGPVCYEINNPGCESIWANDYGAWQGSPGTNPVISTQVTCDGQTINLTWGGFVVGEIVNSASAGNSISILSSGGPTTRQFTLTWDIPLTGPFAFIISNISPGDEDIPAITPAPDSITPDFSTGDANTLHQVLYNDITGINQITIDFETITFPTGTVVVSMDESVPFTVLETGISSAYGVVDTCVDPPTTIFYDINTQDVLTSEEIATIGGCSSDCETKAPTNVCYQTSEFIDTEITLRADQWQILSAAEAQQAFSLPDGQVMNFTFTRLNGGSVASPGQLINGVETVNLTSPTGSFSQWRLSWDIPLTGRFTMLFDDLDSDSGVTVNEQLTIINPVLPDNWTDYQGDIFNERIVFEWETSLIGETSLDFQIDNGGVPEADSFNVVPILATVPVDTVLISSAIAIVDCDNNITYFDANTSEVLTDPNIVPCINVNNCDYPLYVRDCIIHWSEVLCDRIDIVNSLDVYTFNAGTSEVYKFDAITGNVLDSHVPGGGVAWTNGTIYDPINRFYYLYDSNNSHWHRYNADDLAAGNTNLGVFGGDAIVGGFTTGAFDPTTGLGYVGNGGTTRYSIDFVTLTVTQLPNYFGEIGSPFTQVSSLSIDNEGTHFVTNYRGPSQNNAFYSADVATGELTLLGTQPNIQINGADYDQDTESGWYGVNSNLDEFYRWTEADGSDIQFVSDVADPGGTLAVGNADISTTYVRFQRVYHKNTITGDVTFQDHDFEGAIYDIVGVVVFCLDEAAEPRIIANVVDLGSGEEWTASDIPSGQVVTGMTINTIVEAVDSEIIDLYGATITNVPGGLSMSWNTNLDIDHRLAPPQVVRAGTNGRMILNITTRTA